jgi:hypothetical protein
MLLIIALSFVKFCDPYENSFHALMIKIHVQTTISPLLCFYSKDSIVSSIYPPI